MVNLLLASAIVGIQVVGELSLDGSVRQVCCVPPVGITP